MGCRRCFVYCKRGTQRRCSRCCRGTVAWWAGGLACEPVPNAAACCMLERQPVSHGNPFDQCVATNERASTVAREQQHLSSTVKRTAKLTLLSARRSLRPTLPPLVGPPSLPNFFLQHVMTRTIILNCDCCCTVRYCCSPIHSMAGRSAAYGFIYNF
jgi:hypothetical protein